VRVFDPGPYELGEGPIFDVRRNALLWVDIKGKSLLCRELDATETTRIHVDEDVGCLALTDNRHVVIAALRSGWYHVDLRTGERALIAVPSHPAPTFRFNDGAVDVRGRLWTGSLEDSESDPVGELYRLDADGGFRSMDVGFVASNGIDWSPDGHWMYFVDSRKAAIYRYSFEPKSGEIGARELFIDTDGMRGLPDGLAVDSEGTVWCAFWDGAAIHGFSEAGALVETVVLPVLRPTSLTFGGPGLSLMYITSASFGLTRIQRNEWPASGSVLLREARAPGRPPGRFGVRVVDVRRAQEKRDSNAAE
jgi:sugar lactone lactonase YvrE